MLFKVKAQLLYISVQCVLYSNCQDVKKSEDDSLNKIYTESRDRNKHNPKTVF